MTPVEHNDRRWLKVGYLERPPKPGRYPNFQSFQPGWYVVRCCPCHNGWPVTLRLPNEWAAQRAKRMMLRVSAERGELVDDQARRY